MLVCRCCLTFEDNLYSLLDYEVAFQECMGLDVEEAALICPGCIRKLYEAHSFWVQTHKSDQYLKQKQANVVIKSEPVDEDDEDVVTVHPLVKVEVLQKVEDFDEFFDDGFAGNDFSSDDEAPLGKQTIFVEGAVKQEELKKKIVKKEPASLEYSMRAKKAWEDTKPHLIKECPFCLLAGLTKPKLKKHIQEHLDANGGYGCAHCPKKLKTKRVLKQHIVNHHGVMLGLAGAEMTETICTKCSETFDNPRILRRHYKEQHPNEELVSFSSTKTFICTFCDRGFSTKELLRIHEMSHTGVRPFLCGACGKGFKTKENMRTHELIHTDERNFPCEKCGKRFRTAASLKYHIVNHDENPQFSCETCGKQFKQQSCLKSHRRVHIENPALNFACDICGKRFKGQNLLKSHLLTHDDTLRFSCDICGLKFRHRSNWKSHTSLSHSEIREFGCGECGTAFKQKSSLKRHMRQHATKVGLAENCFTIKKSNAQTGFKEQAFLVRMQ